MAVTAEQVITRLQSMSNAENIAGMARYGIQTKDALGISIWELRKIAKEIGTDHALAGQLWDSGIHEARILASYVDDPKQVTVGQLERWVSDFDSWDVCDQVVELFSYTPFAYPKIYEWSTRSEEFVKRAAFALIAEQAAHDKRAPDETFIALLPTIIQASDDERNFVKKAVNWALRNIGKRNRNLNEHAIAAAREIQQRDSRTARWIAADALRELTGEKVQGRLK